MKIFEITESYKQSKAPGAQLKGKEKAPKAKAGRTDHHPYGGRLVGETDMKTAEITENRISAVRRLIDQIRKGMRIRPKPEIKGYEETLKSLMYLRRMSDRRIKSAIDGTGIRYSELRTLIDNDLPDLIDPDKVETMDVDALIAAIKRVERLSTKIKIARSKVRDSEILDYISIASAGALSGMLVAAAADERSKRVQKQKAEKGMQESTQLDESFLSVLTVMARKLKQALRSQAKPGQSEGERIRALRQAAQDIPFSDNEREAVLKILELATQGGRTQDKARKLLYTHFGIRLGKNTGQGYRSGPQLEEMTSATVATVAGSVGKNIKRSQAYNADGTMKNALDVKETSKRKYNNSIRRR